LTSLPQIPQTARIAVRLTPRGGADRIDGWRDGVLLARVRAPAVDGRANEALIALLAGILGVRPSSLHILRGRTVRSKLLSVDGLTQAEVELRLR
jgi:uncharacterized protein YggU (UPF0235/DUF167 family)